ncbi:MAG: hypothetical protein ACXABY_24305, partial [Candidatus Thorarchaeota archaeon]
MNCRKEERGSESIANDTNHNPDFGPEGTLRLDAAVELSKNIAVVLVAALGAYRILSSMTSEFYLVALLIFGGAVIYVLLLPYKVAVLIKGEWGFIARARVVRTIAYGLPMWLLLTIVLLLYPSVSESIVLFFQNPSVVDFQRPLALFSFFIFMGFSAVSGATLRGMLKL